MPKGHNVKFLNAEILKFDWYTVHFDANPAGWVTKISERKFFSGFFVTAECMRRNRATPYILPRCPPLVLLQEALYHRMIYALSPIS
jgi:hypothetical protein